jgi:hypothetical protein
MAYERHIYGHWVRLETDRGAASFNGTDTVKHDDLSYIVGTVMGFIFFIILMCAMVFSLKMCCFWDDDRVYISPMHPREVEANIIPPSSDLPMAPAVVRSTNTVPTSQIEVRPLYIAQGQAHAHTHAHTHAQAHAEGHVLEGGYLAASYSPVSTDVSGQQGGIRLVAASLVPMDSLDDISMS